MTGQQVAPDGRPDVGEIPLGSLVREVAEDLSTLLRQELELAKVETRREVIEAGKAGGAFGGAGIAGWLTMLFVSLAAMFALDAVLPLGWAAFIVAVCWGALAAVFFMVGRRKMRAVNLVPERTVETVREDVQWLQSRSR